MEGFCQSGRNCQRDLLDAFCLPGRMPTLHPTIVLIPPPIPRAEAARRLLHFLNRACFVHPLTGGRPIRNARIAAKDDPATFLRAVERLVFGLSGALVIDDPTWREALAEAVMARMKHLIRRRDRGGLSPERQQHLDRLRTLLAVLTHRFPG